MIKNLKFLIPTSLFFIPVITSCGAQKFGDVPSVTFSGGSECTAQLYDTPTGDNYSIVLTKSEFDIHHMKIDIQIVDAEGDSVVGGWNTYTHSWNHAFSGIYGQKVNEVVWEVTSRGGTPIPPQDAYGGSTPYGYWKVSFVTDDNESDCAQSRLIVYGCIKYSWGTTFDPSREQETTWYYNFF